jgi:hypothetical protein
VNVLLARLAQRLESGRVATTLGQAVAAVAELVRARPEPAVGERRVGGQREGGAQVAAHVLANGQLVNLVLADPVDEAAGLFGALGGVLGQVAGDLPCRALCTEYAQNGVAGCPWHPRQVCTSKLVPLQLPPAPSSGPPPGPFDVGAIDGRGRIAARNYLPGLRHTDWCRPYAQAGPTWDRAHSHAPTPIAVTCR